MFRFYLRQDIKHIYGNGCDGDNSCGAVVCCSRTCCGLMMFYSALTHRTLNNIFFTHLQKNHLTFLRKIQTCIVSFRKKAIALIIPIFF
jgi:hypothetical protein